MAKVILLVIAFLALVIALGLITAWIYNIPLGKGPEGMDNKARALYLSLRPLLFPAELVCRIFTKKQ